jgi:trans-aconitate 2-methyltransferase
MNSSTWSPSQYLKFEDERTRPSRDLLAAVPLDEARAVVDIGCGPGNSTELLARRYPTARVTGIDSSPEMLADARKRLPAATFVEAAAESWSPSGPVDLLFANAVMQWVPDHSAVMERLLAGLAPGGVLAVQVPDNQDEPTHRLMRAVAAEGPWSARFGERIRREVILSPEGYYDRLKPHAAHVEVWRTTYFHPLADAAAIVAWVMGTGLRPFLDRLEKDERPVFLADYERRVAEAYPPQVDGRVLLRFPRLFVVATRG